MTATGIFGGKQYTDTDTKNLHPFILRKEIFLYWDSTENTKTYYDVTGIADDTKFDAKIYDSNNAEVGTITISRSTPAEMWLTDGIYKFLESPDGYTTGYPDGIKFDTSKDYPDWTFPNVIS